MKLAFVDTETTGTDPSLHELWEVAVVIEDTDTDVIGMAQHQVVPQRMDVASPDALRIGGYYERGPGRDAEVDVSNPGLAAFQVAKFTSGAWLVGCNVTFDVRFLDRFLRTYGQSPAWMYSPIDAKSMALADLDPDPDKGLPSTNQIIEEYGIEIDQLGSPEPRHSALTDALIARAIYWRVRTGKLPRRP